MPSGRLRAEQAMRDEQAALNSKLMEIPQPIALEGKVVGGTWDVTNGSAAFQQGDSASSFGDDSDQALIKSYPILTSQPGDYYGTVGNENALVFQSQCGNVMGFIQSTVNPPAVPSGERWILHYNQSGVVDAFTKHTNDGATPGDGLGGAHYGGGAALSMFTTQSGHQVTLNDTAQTVKVTSATGHTVTIDDVAKTITSQTANGHKVVLNDIAAQILVQTHGGLIGKFDDTAQAITHLAGTAESVLDELHSQASFIGPSGTGIGALFSSLTNANRSVMANLDISTFENSLHTQRLADLSNMATAIIAAMTASGVPSLPTAAAIVAALASLAHISVPSGSSIVRVAS